MRSKDTYEIPYILFKMLKKNEGQRAASAVKSLIIQA